MTIAVDMGRKATKTNKQTKHVAAHRVLIFFLFIDHSHFITEPLRPYNQIKPVVINELQFRGMASKSIAVCMPAFLLNVMLGL